MATIAEMIKNSSKNTDNNTVQTTGAGTTQSIKDLLAAKSGKQVTSGSGPRQSNLAERQAIASGQQQQRQVEAQGAVAQEGISARQSELDTQGELQDQAGRQDFAKEKQRVELQTTAILDDYARGIKKVNNQKDLFALEQAGTALRLQNDKYIENLQLAGQYARLDDEASFKEQLRDRSFSDMETLLRDDLAMKTILDSSDREFQAEIGAMDLDYAIQMSTSQAKTAAATQMYSGGSTAVSGAFQALSMVTKPDKPVG